MKGLPYRAAVIGCGAHTEKRGAASAIGYAHGWAYSKEPRVVLAAACDLDEKNRRDYMAEMHLSAGYADYMEMLEKEEIDILSICTYPDLHPRMVTDGVGAGVKVIWVEKPMAYPFSDCQRMVDECAAAGVLLVVSHQRRYGQPFTWTREAIESGGIGTVRNIQITTNVDWWNNIYDVGVHSIDCARSVLGDPRAKEIFAHLEASGKKAYKDGHVSEERCLATVLLDNGVRLVYDCADSVRTGESHIRVNGDLGFIEIFLEEPEGAKSCVRALLAGKPGVVVPVLEEDFHGSAGNKSAFFEHMLGDVLDAFEEGRAPAVCGANALLSMEIVTGMVISAYRGETVTVPFDGLEEASVDVLALWGEHAACSRRRKGK